MTLALITGASAGLGAEFARQLAAEGSDLILVARDEGRLASFAAELRSAHGITVEVLAADLTDRGQLAIVAHRLASVPAKATDPPPVDLLINNAGLGVGGAFVGGDLGRQRQMLELMVGAVLELSHAAAGQMAGRSAGAILNVSSVAAYLPAGPYSAAKSWVSNFSHGLALELAPAGVRVLVLCPGYVHTEFHARARINTGSIPSWSWLEAPAVVRRALLDLRRGRTISIPSVRYRTLCWFLRHAPAPVLRRVVAVRDTQRREQEPSALG